MLTVELRHTLLTVLVCEGVVVHVGGRQRRRCDRGRGTRCDDRTELRARLELQRAWPGLGLGLGPGPGPGLGLGLRVRLRRGTQVGLSSEKETTTIRQT